MSQLATTISDDDCQPSNLTIKVNFICNMTNIAFKTDSSYLLNIIKVSYMQN